MLTIGAIFVGCYATLVGCLYSVQRTLLYYPSPERPHPAEFGVPEMTPVTVETIDGLQLYAWWRPPAGNQPVIAYFHGNAGHLGHRGYKVKPLLEAGYGVLLVSYRYNAGAGGEPSEAGLIRDGQAALRFLEEKGIGDQRVVLYGESLGTGVAVALAAEQPVAALLLEAPYSSMVDLANHHYWYVPVKWLIKDEFASIIRISRVKAPIYMIHGEHDRVIPLKFGKKLFDAAPEPKNAKYYAAAGHNDLYEHGAAEAVLAFLNGLKP